MNASLDCASFSKKKQKWYSRSILLDASSLPEEALNGLVLPDYDRIEEGIRALSEESSSINADTEHGTTKSNTSSNTTSNTDPQAIQTELPDGRYSVNVALTGGSGRASVSTPTLLIVKDGRAYAELLWSSTHYDWMRVNGVTYENEAEEGTSSRFTIPISAFDTVIPVVADTTAMGEPTAIEYSLTFYRESIGDEGLIPQVAAKKVVILALCIIVVGFFLNLYVKKRGKR